MSRCFALLVSVTSHETPDPALLSQPAAANDVTSFHEYLQELFPPSTGSVILSLRAGASDPELRSTRKGIYTKALQLDLLANQPEDFFLFYFAGHGFRFGASDYLLPYEFQLHQNLAPAAIRTLLDNTAIALTDLPPKISAARQLYLIDACRTAFNLEPAPATTAEFRDLGAFAGKAAVRAVWQSCQPYAKARNHEGNGWFFQNAMETLRVMAGPVIDVRQWAELTAARMRSSPELHLQSGEQTPAFQLTGGPALHLPLVAVTAKSGQPQVPPPAAPSTTPKPPGGQAFASLLQESDAAAHRGDHELAAIFLQEALRISPAAAGLRARIQEQERLHQSALAEFRLTSLLTLAHSNRRDGRLAQAVTWLEEAKTLAPHRADVADQFARACDDYARLLLAKARASREDGAAIEFCEYALQQKPSRDLAIEISSYRKLRQTAPPSAAHPPAPPPYRPAEKVVVPAKAPPASFPAHDPPQPFTWSPPELPKQLASKTDHYDIEYILVPSVTLHIDGADHTLREFWISLEPISVRACRTARAAGFRDASAVALAGSPESSLVNLSWDEAAQFCAFVGGYLPDALQWKWAACCAAAAGRASQTKLWQWCAGNKGESRLVCGGPEQEGSQYRNSRASSQVGLRVVRAKL